MCPLQLHAVTDGTNGRLLQSHCHPNEVFVDPCRGLVHTILCWAQPGPGLTAFCALAVQANDHPGDSSEDAEITRLMISLLAKLKNLSSDCDELEKRVERAEKASHTLSVVLLLASTPTIGDRPCYF